MNRPVVANTFWNLGSFFVSGLVLVVSVPVLVRCLGLSQYGILALVMAATGTLSVLNAGIAQATIKYVSGLIAEGNDGGAGDIVSTSLFLNLFAGLVAIVIVWMFSDIIALRVMRVDLQILPAVEDAFLLGAVIWGVAQINLTFQGAVEGCQKYGALAPISILQTVFRVSLSILAAIYFRSIRMVLFAQLSCDLIFVYFWWRTARRVMPNVRLRPAISWRSFRMMRQFVSWQMVNMLFGQVAGVADRFFLSAIRGLSAVGIYAIPQRIMNTLQGLMGQMYRALLPAMGAAVHHEGRSERQLLEYSWHFSFLLSLCFLTIFTLASPLMRIWVGAETGILAAPLLRIFCVTLMFELPSVGVSRYLLGHGFVKWGTISNMASTIVTLVMIYSLGTKFGVVGIACSGLVSLVITRTVFHYWLLRERFVAMGAWKSFVSLYSHILFASFAVICAHVIEQSMGTSTIGKTAAFSFIALSIFSGMSFSFYRVRSRKLIEVVSNMGKKAFQYV